MNINQFSHIGSAQHRKYVPSILSCYNAKWYPLFKNHRFYPSSYPYVSHDWYNSKAIPITTQHRNYQSSQELLLFTALRQSGQGMHQLDSSELVIDHFSKIEGLGKSTIRKYLDYLGFRSSIRIKDLNQFQKTRLYQHLNDWIESRNILIGNNHLNFKQSQLQKLRSIQSYRGIRNAKGLPVRGQKTKSNARTKRKLRIT